MSVFNIAAGYVMAVALGAIAVGRRGWPEFIGGTLAVPMYWLVISLASYRALYQLVRAPHFWEKTEHGSRPRPRSGSRG